MLAHTSFERIPRWGARLIVLLVVVLTVIPAVPHRTLDFPGYTSGVLPRYTDLTLYRDVVADVAHGQDYYRAAAKEQRAHRYPTAPAVVFREPALAWLLAGLHFAALGYALLVGILVAMVLVLHREMTRRSERMWLRLLTIFVGASGLAVAGIPDALYFHEVWAGMLLAASLLLYHGGRWWPSVLIGLIACLVRELALPYLLAMLAFALFDKRWREAAGWIAAIAVFGVLFGMHLARAAAMYQPGDLVSRGWLAFSGWNFVVLTARWNFLLRFLPGSIVALAACASVIGYAGLRDDRARRAALVVAGYLAAFAIVGRPDNNYWGILLAPLVPLGWMLAPAALRDLLARAGLMRVRG